jgi:outer membrane autotransporter protein
MHTWTTQKRPITNAFRRKTIACKLKFALQVAWKPKVVTLVALYMALSASLTSSQTLDKAVTNQLDFGPAFTQPCFELLDKGGQPIGSLEDICTRSAPLPGAGPSTSAGGAAATPTALPAIVQKRLREARGEESSPQTKEPAASAAGIAKLGNRLNIFYSGEYKGLKGANIPSGNSYGDIRRLSAGAGYRQDNGPVARPKENLPRAVKASHPDSRVLLAHQHSNSLDVLQVQPLMGVRAEASNRKSTAFEIAKGPLRVTGVEIHEATANSAIIRIQVDQAVIDYKAFPLSDPPRIVVDITAAFMADSMSKKKAGKGAIKQIRASQYRGAPKPVVRVVLDLASALPYQVVGLPDTFQLMIGAAVAQADPVKPPAPPPVTAERPKLAPEELRIDKKPTQPFRGSMSLWGNGQYEDLDRDVTTFEDGYDSDIWRVTVGADYSFTERIAAGLAFDYYRHDGDYKSGGNFQTDSYGILGFASFLPFDNSWAQVSGGWARKDYERTRFAALADTRVTTQESVQVVNGSVNGDYNGDEYRAGALLGYDFHIKNITISPRTGLDWVHLEYDRYKEKGKTIDSKNNFIAPGDSTGLELTFHDDDQTLFQSRLGVQGSVVFRTGFGLIAPHVSFDWRHEFENDQRNVDVSFVEDLNQTRFSYKTAKPERNWYEFNAGVVTAFENRFQIFGNYRTIIGHSFFDSHAGTIGMSYSF